MSANTPRKIYIYTQLKTTNNELQKKKWNETYYFVYKTIVKHDSIYCLSKLTWDIWIFNDLLLSLRESS